MGRVFAPDGQAIFAAVTIIVTVVVVADLTLRDTTNVSLPEL
jgi:hypothetical protein